MELAHFRRSRTWCLWLTAVGLLLGGCRTTGGWSPAWFSWSKPKPPSNLANRTPNLPAPPSASYTPTPPSATGTYVASSGQPGTSSTYGSVTPGASSPSANSAAAPSTSPYAASSGYAGTAGYGTASSGYSTAPGYGTTSSGYNTVPGYGPTGSSTGYGSGTSVYPSAGSGQYSSVPAVSPTNSSPYSQPAQAAGAYPPTSAPSYAPSYMANSDGYGSSTRDVAGARVDWNSSSSSAYRSTETQNNWGNSVPTAPNIAGTPSGFSTTNNGTATPSSTWPNASTSQSGVTSAPTSTWSTPESYQPGSTARNTGIQLDTQGVQPAGYQQQSSSSTYTGSGY